MIQVCKYASMQVCKHLSMKVCKYARGHLVPEQRGRLIGKGPLPKEKLMKVLGEVSSHCEIFSIKYRLILNLTFKGILSL